MTSSASRFLNIYQAKTIRKNSSRWDGQTGLQHIVKCLSEVLWLLLSANRYRHFVLTGGASQFDVPVVFCCPPPCPISGHVISQVHARSDKMRVCHTPTEYSSLQIQFYSYLAASQPQPQTDLEKQAGKRDNIQGFQFRDIEILPKFLIHLPNIFHRIKVTSPVINLTCFHLFAGSTLSSTWCPIAAQRKTTKP